ncbi:nitrate ABC transporter substrate-binding protein [Pandoraea iniqua]|uniref:Nitrate ABC transporter substrate-binding protein n=1 Tax=Pandoraea iniqua TaxID=2508288 RepID=A0A5E4XNK8_9BURK|nr:ABC transporter substrate-binding protein [Pandoraea iniqua]VVE37698.1 nitrate ABC transporter substrate-binding protein [Pandoraea iniqua]
MRFANFTLHSLHKLAPSPLIQRFKPSGIRRHALRLLLVGLSLATAVPVAQAEGRIRIAEQFGIVYLLLNVVRDQQLIEQEGRKLGVDVKVDWAKLSGGAAINDALLSGAIDIAGAGVGPLITVWDRTYGRQNVKGVASLGSLPYYLISNNPKVRTIADFTEKDRIALPAVSVSVQSRVLQYAAAKQWGDGSFDRLDKLTQTMAHPDAAAAIIAGGTEITGHFGTPPFQEQELAANPNAHIVLDSYEVLGGPSSATVLYTTEKYRNDNPKTYRAFVLALARAADFVKHQPEAAADIYIRVNQAKTDKKLLVSIIKDPKVDFSITPQNTLGLAQFMQRVGAVRHKPASWRDYFFAEPALGQGS